MHINDFYAIANRVYEMYDNGLTTEDLALKEGVLDIHVHDLFGRNYTLTEARNDLATVRQMMAREEVAVGGDNAISLVISMNNLGGVAHVNTWAFGSKAEAEAFIASGKGNWVSDTGYAIRELALESFAFSSEEDDEECDGDCDGQCEQCYEKAIDRAEDLMNAARDAEMGL